ncbi:hypothetical protein RJ640_005252 [Escallonia rubra]|uniref:RING-type E3 ubiquitin transferase n=1 Tax=Escallonia rubra TaxID=112253 RepID=A0AA88QX28_9ASTE|nr:hypothetical protein RJ640_005252 [Escallonia rubra]
MIQRFDRSDRRILKYPAVHPCEGISPATLLGSLITLSQTICNYHSKLLATQRKNARETIRQIGILSLFFQEIRDLGLNLPSSSVLCFSELHFSFQKIQFLLEDCTREGARVWMLMKAHVVATQFRVLIRSVATALDVLPLGLLDVSQEVRELVEMVANQARKANLELDPDDESAMNSVILILNQFENRFEPIPSVIKQVLDHLDIKSWIGCQNEIRFLDEEMGLECVDGNEREIPLLSSLIGFMSYCRGVLFEDSDIRNMDDKSEGRRSMEMLNCLNLEDFRCPISLELMTDPVTVSTGQTYDRVSIQKWLKAGNLLCPKTGKVLATTELVPNSALRKLIHQLCADHGVSMAKSKSKNRDISRTIIPGSPAAAEAIRFLCTFLAGRLHYGTDDQRCKAAYEVRILGKSNIFNRSCLIESGTIPPLLTLLTSINPSLQENAIAALLKLSKHPNGKKIIVHNGGLSIIVAVLKDGLKLEARQIAAATIFYLSSVYKYRILIGRIPKAIPALVELLKDGTSYGKKNALVAIFALLLYPRNHQIVHAAGIVPILVDLLASSYETDLITDALAVLATLADRVDESTSLQNASFLALVIRILQSSSMSRGGKEHCVSILLSLCNNCGEDVIAFLAKDSSFMASLYSMVTDGTAHASKKARSLIRIIHKFHETSSSHMLTKEGPNFHEHRVRLQ